MKIKIKTKEYRRSAVNDLRRALPSNKEDALNALLVDPLATLIQAADAQGFTREEIREAVRRGAFHGWADVRAAGIGDGGEADGEGRRFADSLGAPSPVGICGGCRGTGGRGAVERCHACHGTGRIE